MAQKRSTRKPARKTVRKKSGGGGSLLPWFAVATVLAIVGYDHWSSIGPELTSLSKGTAAAPVLASMRPAVPAPVAKPQAETPSRSADSGPIPSVPIPIAMPVPMPTASAVPALSAASVSESFGLCGQGTHINCVFDGSTFWVRGTKIRIADIETPALGPSRCVEEERRANAAKLRLLSLLNAGPFTLQPGSSAAEATGAAQRRVLRGGQSFGDTLVREGLAHRRMDRPTSWCA